MSKIVKNRSVCSIIFLLIIRSYPLNINGKEENVIVEEEFINKLIEKSKSATDNFTIIFLANVKDKTVNLNDYKDTSVLTEFLSMEEYQELLTSLQNFGFYVITYFDTEKFIVDYLNGKYATDNLIIFEGTQKGIGHARDTLIPAFCDLQNLLHTGPNAYVNSICINKYNWTKLLAAHSILVPNSWRFDSNGWSNGHPDKDMLLIAKPNYECASIGIHKESVSYLTPNYTSYLYKMTHKYNQSLIVQEFIPGYEVEVPIIINNREICILPPVVLSQSEQLCMNYNFLDFDNIYDDNYSFSLLKNINESWEHTIKECSENICNILELERYTRIDFRLTDKGDTYVTDINSYPHIVSHSSFGYVFEQLNIGCENILPCLIGNII